MTTIASSRLKDWSLTQDNAGSISYQTEQSIKIITSSVLGSDRAFIYKRVSAHAGDLLTLRFKAKAVSGNFYYGVDYPAAASGKVAATGVTQDWVEYELEYAIPDTALQSAYVQFVIGHITGYSGEVYIADVRIESKYSQLPTARVFAAALITLNDGAAGSAYASPNYTTIGINQADMLTRVASSTLVISIPPTVGGALSMSAPIFSAQITADNANFYKVSAKVNGYNRDTGLLTISFIDTTTGMLIDVSTLGVGYLWFTAIAS